MCMDRYSVEQIHIKTLEKISQLVWNSDKDGEETGGKINTFSEKIRSQSTSTFVISVVTELVCTVVSKQC